MPAAISPTPRQPDSHARKATSAGSKPAVRKSGERSRVAPLSGHPRFELASRTPLPSAPLQQLTPSAATSSARRDGLGILGAYQSVQGIGMIRSMAQGLRELVGRVMIDPEFLAELQRAPEPLLAQYELTDAERTTVRQALVRLAATPPSERRHELRNILIRRVAT